MKIGPIMEKFDLERSDEMWVVRKMNFVIFLKLCGGVGILPIIYFLPRNDLGWKHLNLVMQRRERAGNFFIEY